MIDWDRVDELRSEIGAEDFADVVELFLEEVDETIDRLSASPDPARYEEDLHFLKGSALNLGFRQFSDLCAEGERNAASGMQDQVDIAAVIASYRATKDQFLSQLGKNHAA